jgi:hypothetical protein
MFVRVAIATSLRDVGKRLVDEIWHLSLPVDGADVPACRLQLAPQGLCVLHSAVAGLLGSELGIGEPPPLDQVLQFHLGCDLRRLNVGVERPHENVDRLIGSP